MPRRTANNQLARAGEGRAGEVLAASATVMAAQDALPPPASVALAKSPLPDTAIVPVAPRHDGWTPDRQRALSRRWRTAAASKAQPIRWASAW